MYSTTRNEEWNKIPSNLLKGCRREVENVSGAIFVDGSAPNKSQHSGSDIAMCDYQESVTTGQTDRHRTKRSLCAAMLRRRHKNW